MCVCVSLHACKFFSSLDIIYVIKFLFYFLSLYFIQHLLDFQHSCNCFLSIMCEFVINNAVCNCVHTSNALTTSSPNQGCREIATNFKSTWVGTSSHLQAWVWALSVEYHIKNSCQLSLICFCTRGWWQSHKGVEEDPYQGTDAYEHQFFYFNSWSFYDFFVLAPA